jgi:hypothetical protein
MRVAIPLASFGAPVSPFFVAATKTWVYNNAERRLATTAFNQVFWQYKCRYCVADPQVMTLEGCWHQEASTQIDHIIPWTTVRNSAYYNEFVGAFIAAGIAPFGAIAVNWANNQQAQAIYNDLDNLQVVCTAHNSSSHKGSSATFNTKMIMGIPNLVNHKI